MDEMNIITKFTTGILSKIITKAISKKLGIDTDISLNGLHISISGDRAHIHLDGELSVGLDDIKKLLSGAGL